MSLGNRGGRPPKPTALHVLHGTYRKDRHGGTAPAIAGGVVRMPHGLTGEAKAFWQRIITPLVHAGVVTAIDVPAATMLCEAWGLYRAAAALAANNPLDADARCAMSTYQGMFDKLAARFGLTPVDRQRLKIEPTATVGIMKRDRSDKSRFFK